MKRFLIHVSTYWCGMDDTFRAVAESELDLCDAAEDLAYNNFQSYGCEADIAEDQGYDPDEMEDSDWDKLWETVDESEYYNFYIEEFEGDDEGMLNDIAVEGICNLVKTLYEKRTIFIITGREGTPEIIEATKKWLDSNDIKVDGLFFRPVKDYSPGAECKKKIYEDNIKGKYNVEFVLDDNYKCVEMWREQGLVCLQPNEGKF